MNIAGIGIVCARGRGMASLEQALEQGWVPPVEAGAGSGHLPVYAVTPETLTDKAVLAKARRADRFARMSVLAAADALQDSGLGTGLDKARLGVIMSTAFGPHVTTFSFLDGILDFGDAAVSPTAFSHSVHNAAASYIAMTLEARGPTLTLTHFDFAFHQAIVLAQAWLERDRCDAVLVGATDELGVVLQYVCSRMLKPATDGKIKPFAFSATPEVVPGEGSVFFMMTRETSASRYGRVVDVSWNAALPATSGGALHILDACGMAKDETEYRDAVTPGLPAAGYAPLFGSVMTGSAFHAATAALMLQRQKQYASPVLDNPHDVAICRKTEPSQLQDIFCTRIGCGGGRGVIHLAR
jgi:3-oxoacyl-[acyl-carrier-protein] synthase II